MYSNEMSLSLILFEQLSKCLYFNLLNWKSASKTFAVYQTVFGSLLTLQRPQELRVPPFSTLEFWLA